MDSILNVSIPTDATTEDPPQSSNDSEEVTGGNLGFIVAGGMGAVILVMAIVMIRMRAQRQLQPTIQQSIPPVNNEAFEPECAAVNYDEVGNVMPPSFPISSTSRQSSI